MKPQDALLFFVFAAQLASAASLETQVPDTKWFEKLDFDSYDECYSDNTEGQLKNTGTICLDSDKKPVQHAHFPNPGYEHSADCMAYGEYQEFTETHITFQTGRGICNNGNLLTAKRYVCERLGGQKLLCTADSENAEREWKTSESLFIFRRIKETPND